MKNRFLLTVTMCFLLIATISLFGSKTPIAYADPQMPDDLGFYAYIERGLVDNGLDGLGKMAEITVKYYEQKLSEINLCDDDRKFYTETVRYYKEDFEAEYKKIKILAELVPSMDKNMYAWGKSENLVIEILEIPLNETKAAKAKQITKEAPIIRAIWCEKISEYSRWLAIEGCYELRIAKELGMTPIIIDITDNHNLDVSKLKMPCGEYFETYEELYQALQNHTGFFIGFEKANIVAGR